MPKMCGIGRVLTHLRPFMPSIIHRNASAKPATNLVIADKFSAVTIISINRPEKQNAMNEALLHELGSQLTQFEEDNSAAVAIINGIGGNFSAGYDIDELKQKCEHDTNAIQKSLILPFRRKTSKPLLCTISGLCKAIGFEIALMCDIRYAEKRSFYEFSNRRFGIPLLNEGPERLAKLIGHSKAIDFLFMDKQINSQEAIDLGIVNEIVQDGTALGSAIKNAAYISSLPQAALHHDLDALERLSLDEEKWQSILVDIKSYVSLSEESLKSARKSKLNNMSEWELEEIEYEKKYANTKQMEK